jgi:uncharacterized protein with HEPN domain
MPPEKDDASYLWDMLDAAKAIKEFIAGRSYQDYLCDRMFRGAVERHLEIIGEAAGKVSKVFRDAHPEIPWRAIVGQRNVLAHEYDEVRHEALWGIATRRIPELIAALRAILPGEKGIE